ncbi:MAG: TetR/AcrR family transcriptional regulator [Pseudomonadota bacterium]
MTKLSPRGRQIVEAARDLVEREGASALTMRALAARVGVRAPSLYKHVPGKDELEAHVVDAALVELGRALDAADGLDGIAHAYRRFALERPHLYRLAASADAARDRFELAAAPPLLRVLGSARRARAAWAFLHGMAELELNEMFASDADVEAAWRAGIAAFRPPSLLAQRRGV